ncbi:MAG: tryptophan--tRNA ligase, partial [Enterobacter roggenkampii]|nr:tryptophan--tRNA ligase [Enterobacter roggenkampii]
SELLLCHGMVCVVGRMRDLILQLSKSSIYSTKPRGTERAQGVTQATLREVKVGLGVPVF